MARANTEINGPLGADNCQDSYSSRHVGGCHFLFCDGAVQFISENIDFTTYQNLARRDDENVLGDF